MSSEYTSDVIARKNAQRAALKREYMRQLTSPHNTESTIFDPAIQRFHSMNISRIEFFKETPRTALRALGFFVIPFGLALYVIKTDRDRKEASYRAGEVAYKDRLFKFV